MLNLVKFRRSHHEHQRLISTLYPKYQLERSFLYFLQNTVHHPLIVLYRSLSVADFSTWANITSIIFLMLLWIDCGFRKSIPRFCPEFSRDKLLHKRFITYLILFYSTLLMISVPLFISLTDYFSGLFSLKTN